MTETLSKNPEMTQGELVTEREVLEGMGKDALVDFILIKGTEVGELERLMNLAGDVLEGYGTSIDKELDKRETNNGNQT